MSRRWSDRLPWLLAGMGAALALLAARRPGPSLQGKVVLITGASSGIGAALAREFHRHGCRLALVARRQEHLQALADEIGKAGSTARAFPGDVTVEGSIEQAMADAARHFGRLDVVVANAGFGVVGRFERLELEDYRRQFETNVFGVLRTAKAALAHLGAGGQIVITGSVTGFIAAPETSPYAMSKHAIRALAQALDGELRRQGIAVTHVAPGFVTSEIRQVDNRGGWHEKPATTVPAWLEMPADVAARQIVAAVRRRRPEVVITLHGKILVFISRHFPRFTRLLLRRARGRREPKPSP